MKIIISESQYRLLTERLGVPNNIIETANKFYNQIIKHLNDYIYVNITSSEDFSIHDEFKFDTYTFKRFNVSIEHKQTNKISELILYRETMGFDAQAVKTSNNKYVFSNDNVNEKTTYLKIYFASPKDHVSLAEIKNVLIENKSKFIGDLSHELMHFYERYKSKFSSLTHAASYNGTQNIHSGIEPLDEMLFYIYYTDKLENITRSSELFAELNDKNITKEKFMSYLKNSSMYSLLKEMKNFSLDKTISLMKNYSKEMDNILNNGKSYDIDEKINRLFYVLYVQIVNNTTIMIDNYLTSNSFERMFGMFDPDKKEFAQKINQSYINKSSNFMIYFRKKEKEIRKSADKVIRNIGRLYDLLPSETEKNIRSLDEWKIDHIIRKVKGLDPNVEIIDLKKRK